MTDATIIPADKAYRNKMLIVFGVLMLGVAVLSQWGAPAVLDRMQAALDSGDNELLLQYTRGVEIAFAVLFLGFLPFCFYNVRMGLKARNEQRFPCSSMRVLRDTPLLTGEDAVKRGNLLVGLGIVLMVVSVFAAIFAVMVIESTISGVVA